MIEKSTLRERITILKVKPQLAPYDVGICVRKSNTASRLIAAFWAMADA